MAANHKFAHIPKNHRQQAQGPFLKKGSRDLSTDEAQEFLTELGEEEVVTALEVLEETLVDEHLLELEAEELNND